MRRRCSVQSLPIHPSDEPLPLHRSERADRGIGAGPGKVTAMQATLAEPDAGAVPDQELEAVLASVAKGVGRAVTRAAPEGVLYPLGESVNTGTHVDRFDYQPDLGRCRDHGSCRRRSTNHATLSVGSSILQPPGLWSRTALPVTGAPTLTGTKVRDDFADATASLSLRSQR